MHHALDQFQRPRAECQLGASSRAKQIRDQGKRCAPHVGEEQGRPARGDDAAMDLGRLLVGVDRRGDLDEVAIVAKAVDERPQVREH
jgi:hypothetical protein